MPEIRRDAFWDGHTIIAHGGYALLGIAAKQFVNMQKLAHTTQTDEQQGVVYCWFGHQMLYIGSAATTRTRQEGLSANGMSWCEHMTFTRKRGLPDSQRICYARSTCASSRAYLSYSQTRPAAGHPGLRGHMRRLAEPDCQWFTDARTTRIRSTRACHRATPTSAIRPKAPDLPTTDHCPDANRTLRMQ